MAKDLLINVSEGEECRIALLEDGRLQELYMERTSATSHVGNIYKGRVTNVEASIQAAFVDFGLGRNGFLHISDLMPTYFGRQGEEIHETVGRKMARRDRPPIQRCLRRGDEIVVQIIKEGIGTKGPTLTTYLSVPGKILVMMPGVGKSGVSRKIEDEVERRRLRQILDELDPPDDAGFIIRTAGIGAAKAEIQRDLSYLTRLWTTFKKKRDSGPGPTELYTEGDLITRTVRDVFTTDVDRLVIDNKEVVSRVKDVIKLANPRTRNKVELYEDPIPMFDKFGVEREIELMYSRHVPLPSGGSLVIDSTEAIVAIDINSGKSRDFSDAETTAFKTDMEAADEICRQLKLRDLGGVIICDFIDLRYERHRRELWNRLDHNLKGDRAKTKVLPMSQFGIVEMTRQRMRPSLKRSVYFDCPHCKGGGLVKTPESMSLDVMRRIRIAINDQRVARVELAVCADVAFYLQNKKRQQLGELEARYEKRIVIRSDAGLGLDEMRISLFDNREGTVIVDGLGMLAQPPHTTQLGTRPYPSQQQRGRGGRGGGGGRADNDRKRNDQRPSPRHEPREDEIGEDRFDRVEAEVEDREDGEPVSTPPAGRDDDQAMDPSEELVQEQAEPVQDEPDRDARPRDDRPRDDRQRDDRPRDDRQRDNRPRDDRQRSDRQRSDRDGPRPDNRGGGRGDPRQQGGHRDITYGRGNDNRAGNQGGQGGRGDNRQGGNQPDNRQDAHRPDNRPVGRNDLAPVNRNPVREGPAGPDQGIAGQNGDGQRQEGGGRRRRRRGRRGRGRNRELQEGQQLPQSQHPDADDRSGPRSDERGPNDEAVRQLEDTFSEEDAVDVAADRERQPDNLDSDLYEREDRSGESEFRDRDRESEFEHEPDREETREPQREPEPDTTPEPVVEKPATEPAEKSRRRRAAPSARRAPKPKSAAAKPKAAKVVKPAKPSAASKGRKRKSTTKAAQKSAEPGGSTVEAPVVVRTGSTDRHLIEDEPVLPQPARRPRSVRDLDSIPDDFDE